VHDNARPTSVNQIIVKSPANYEPLRRSLGCPPDGIEVHGLDNCQLVASFRFKMFQKLLRVSHSVDAEFVVAGLRSQSFSE
jgi:hypothetical protein